MQVGAGIYGSVTLSYLASSTTTSLPSLGPIGLPDKTCCTPPSWLHLRLQALLALPLAPTARASRVIPARHSTTLFASIRQITGLRGAVRAHVDWNLLYMMRISRSVFVFKLNEAGGVGV